VLVESLGVEESNAAAVFVCLPHLSGGGPAVRIVRLPHTISVARDVQIFGVLDVFLKIRELKYVSN